MLLCKGNKAGLLKEYLFSLPLYLGVAALCCDKILIFFVCILVVVVLDLTEGFAYAGKNSTSEHHLQPGEHCLFLH